MYVYTAQELKLIHEERVGNVTKQQVQPRNDRPNSALKQLKKLFKRDEA